MESMQGGSGFLNEYLYVGGQRVARVANLGPIYYYYGDHLGTARLITDGGGTKCYDADYFPWGGEQHVYVNSCAQNYKFTGKERDPDTGSDYFGARWYRNTMARFYSPDWSTKPQAVPYADLTSPQSLNLYSYVVNNPLNRTDPLGHNWFDINGKWQWHKGDSWTDANGNTYKSQYTGLLVAQATGTDKKTGATLYSLTLYDQNKVAATGTGFSGGEGHPGVNDGNYTLRLDIRDANGPNTINPQSPVNNPPVFYGIQRMHNIPAGDGTAWDVVGAYGEVRAYLNLFPGQHGTDGAFVHGQFNGHGWTHGCLSYGPDRAFGETLWNLPSQRLPVSIDTPVEKP
jgi:RHS repeat-associated protein